MNVADRLDALGGGVVIESVVGKGTTIAGTMPTVPIRAA